MELFFKKGEEYLPITTSQIFSTSPETSFLVVSVDTDKHVLSNAEIEDIVKAFENYNIPCIVTPSCIKDVTSFKFDDAFNYLLIIKVPNTIPEKEVEDSFLEILKPFKNVHLKVTSSDIEISDKLFKDDWPPLTRDMILHIDGTPNAEYPLRILKTYRENCNSKWESNVVNNPICDIMNKHQDQRARILDKAIEILEESKNE